ncbi:MAG: hypothetical protein AVDCRST_MAG85-1841, partial [uncultured Solirubrobacteraceae bacterium]
CAVQAGTPAAAYYSDLHCKAFQDVDWYFEASFPAGAATRSG